MSTRILDLYLQRILTFAELPPEREATVREEIASHLEESQASFQKQGLSEDDALWKAIEQYGHPRVVGLRLRRPWQWVDIRQHGTARGFLAIGPRAVGVFAFGGIAVGVVAIGGLAAGLFSVGGFALALLLSWGGLSIGGIATGGLAIGLVAMGGCALGLVATGGGAYGLWAPAGGHVVSWYTAENVPSWLQSLEPLLKVPAFINSNMAIAMPVLLLLVFAPSVIMALHGRKRQQDPPSPESWLMD